MVQILLLDEDCQPVPVDQREINPTILEMAKKYMKNYLLLFFLYSSSLLAFPMSGLSQRAMDIINNVYLNIKCPIQGTKYNPGANTGVLCPSNSVALEKFGFLNSNELPFSVSYQGRLAGVIGYMIYYKSEVLDQSKPSKLDSNLNIYKCGAFVGQAAIQNLTAQNCVQVNYPFSLSRINVFEGDSQNILIQGLITNILETAAKNITSNKVEALNIDLYPKNFEHSTKRVHTFMNLRISTNKTLVSFSGKFESSNLNYSSSVYHSEENSSESVIPVRDFKQLGLFPN